MECVKITANLMSGFATNDRWSPRIDGILAYQWQKQKLGEEGFNATQGRIDLMTLVDDLPLEIIRFNDLWWYAASSPIYDESLQHQRHLHRRFDALHAESHATPTKTGKVLVQAGKFKNTRLPLTQHITAKIEWHVIGDLAEIKSLLVGVTHIGARVGAGFGRVRSFEFTQGDEHLARNYRHLPVDYVEDVGDKIVMQRGLVPPFRHSAGQCLCVMP